MRGSIRVFPIVIVYPDLIIYLTCEDVQFFVRAVDFCLTFLRFKRDRNRCVRARHRRDMTTMLRAHIRARGVSRDLGGVMARAGGDWRIPFNLRTSIW